MIFAITEQPYHTVYNIITHISNTPFNTTSFSLIIQINFQERAEMLMISQNGPRKTTDALKWNNTPIIQYR